MTLFARNCIVVMCLFLAGASAGWAGLFSASFKDKQEYVHARQTYEKGDYQQAITELSQYIYKTQNIKRREARAYRLLGKSYEQLGQLDKALEVYQEALEFHQKNIPLLLAAASLYQRTKLTDRSIEMYDRVLEQEPDNQEALAGQADNYIDMGFYSKAHEYYDRLFALNPQTPAIHRARYAYAFLRQRDYPNAFIHITMAKTEEPENTRYWLLSAYAYKGLGKLDDALADLDIAIWLAPQQTELRAIKSMWLYQQKNNKASLQEARALLAEEPTNELALFMVYLNLKDSNPKQARQALQKIKDFNTDSFAHRVAEKLLQK